MDAVRRLQGFTGLPKTGQWDVNTQRAAVAAGFIDTPAVPEFVKPSDARKRGYADGGWYGVPAVVKENVTMPPRNSITPIAPVPTSTTQAGHWNHYTDAGGYGTPASSAGDLKLERVAKERYEKELNTYRLQQRIKSFIDYLYDQVDRKSVYVWSGNGQDGRKLTADWIESHEKKTDDVAKFNKNYNRAKKAWENRLAQSGDFYAFDCSGLASRWLIDNGYFEKKNSAEMLRQKTTGGQKITDKERTAYKAGNTATLKLQPGQWVFDVQDGKAVHIGYIVGYDANGGLIVIHAKGRDHGVVAEGIFDSRDWNYYGTFNYLP